MKLRRQSILRVAGLLTLVLLLLPQSLLHGLPFHEQSWSQAERAQIASLSLAGLGPPPADPSNAVADDPRAVEFGRTLFFDTRLSGTGEVSCATCHRADLQFTDGLAKARGIGEARRNTASLIGAAYSPWLYWDGRKDSLWSQALSPLEAPAEQGGNRLALAHLVAIDTSYHKVYEALFGALPDLSDRRRFPEPRGPQSGAAAERAFESLTSSDRHAVNAVFANLGKAIAAYERTLLPEQTRFDRYASAVAEQDAVTQAELFSQDEINGLRLFIGEAGCTACHNGPLFTNNEFHNTGILTYPGDVPDKGRIDGLRELRADPFNCLGDFSDDADHHCPELRFARSGIELLGALRTPSLRNLAGTGPYMHQGQMAELGEVLDHYNRAPLALIGHNEAKPLGLSRRQLERLEAFLRTLAPATPARQR